MELSDLNIAVIGLGYVGLPLAVELGKKYPTVGFDVKDLRVAELKKGEDSTLEVSSEELAEAGQLKFTTTVSDIEKCNFYIVTVPTPIDANNRPELSPLQKASTTVGQLLSPNDIVVYESTVYPGVTEEVCVPILEEKSGLKFNEDFFAGYSPERINPGDKQHRLVNILKVTSGSTPKIADFIDSLYSSIIDAGTYKAESIKVAEAAKVIENTQRDLNIALINELALIFDRLDIDTEHVLKAAGTKWNFLNFRPGLVGGHCIGVDPYYLTHKAQEVGYNPEIILAGRRINDHMSSYVVSRLIKEMIKKGTRIRGSKVLVLGLAFKENCPDLRNTKVIDIVSELTEYGVHVEVVDPWVDPVEAEKEYSIKVSSDIGSGYDAAIVAVGHKEFVDAGTPYIKSACNESHVIYDLKYVLPEAEVDLRL